MRYTILALLILTSCTKPHSDAKHHSDISCQEETDTLDSALDACAGNEADLLTKLSKEKEHNKILNTSCDQLAADFQDLEIELVASKQKLDNANAEIFKLHQRLIEAGLEQK